MLDSTILHFVAFVLTVGIVAQIIFTTVMTSQPKTLQEVGTTQESTTGDISCEPTQEITETVIFIDWDDTLLPSSLIFHTLADENSLILTEEHVPSFLELDEAVISLLKMALLYTSNVFIVTNAEVGWVERSSKLYLPRTCELLNSIRVISARTRYEKKHPGKPNIWKELVFRETLHDDLLFGQVPIKLNLVSLGDSECERIALQSMEGHFPSRTIVKSIKYVDAPTIDQLCKEHQVILSNFDFICTSPTNLDLALQMYHTDKQAQQETINTKRKYCHHQKHDGKDGKSPTKQASCEHFPDVSAPHEHVPMIRQEGLSPEDSEDEQ